MHTSTGWEWLSWTNWLRLQQQTLITPELTRAPVGVSSDDVGPHAFCVALMKHQGWPSLCCPIRPLYRHSRGVSCDYCTQLAKNTLGILCFHLLSVLLKVNKGLAYLGRWRQKESELKTSLSYMVRSQSAGLCETLSEK